MKPGNYGHPSPMDGICDCCGEDARIQRVNWSQKNWRFPDAPAQVTVFWFCKPCLQPKRRYDRGFDPWTAISRYDAVTGCELEHSDG